jgi:hypothetical protein
VRQIGEFANGVQKTSKLKGRTNQPKRDAGTYIHNAQEEVEMKFSCI